MMDIAKILLHLNQSSLSKFLSRSSLETLESFDKALVSPEALRKLILNKIPKDIMLRNREMRKALLNGLSQNDAISLAKKLKITNPNIAVYEKLAKLSVRENSSREIILFDYFETKIPEIEKKSERPNSEIIRSEHVLYDHQYDAKVLTMKYLDRYNVALLQMPTGSGKTRTAMSVVTSYLRKNKNSFVIWLAHNEELCEQAISEFKASWSINGDRDIQLLRFFKNYNPDIIQKTKNHNGVFMVAGLKKMYNRANKEIVFLRMLSDRASLVIIDEAHQAIAKTYKKILEVLVQGGVKLLGLTATPGRTWNNLDEDKKLSAFFKKKRVVLLKDNAIKYLTKNGYIAKPKYQPLEYEMDELSPTDKRSIESALDMPPGVLEKLANNLKRNIMIIKQIEELSEKHKRIIVFATTKDNAKDLSITLTARGHNAYYLTGETPSKQRRNIIDEYSDKDQAVKILCNYGVLTMGFDAPKTSAVVIARPTKSLVLYTQMVGRAIRGPRVGGNKYCTICTVVDTELQGFGSITDAYSNWEDVWVD